MLHLDMQVAIGDICSRNLSCENPSHVPDVDHNLSIVCKQYGFQKPKFPGNGQTFEANIISLFKETFNNL